MRRTKTDCFAIEKDSVGMKNDGGSLRDQVGLRQDGRAASGRPTAGQMKSKMDHVLART